ncbi:MAG TPA: type II secretion system inner membrane protein GspF [Thiobacillaceae bacterium]|nr:type II secretion system inner membrane protein GspF [Thiobacillaceae bacterium]HNU64075.1 type II secretion system inner membrane protein GspF [Thiobacillaceae bacterium]
MTAWRYVAVDSRGHRHRGEMEAEHTRAVRARLREQGLLAEEITSRDTPSTAALVGGGRIPPLALALFSRQFSTLLLAGLTIERALAALMEERGPDRLREVLHSVHQDVLAGHGLGQTLQRHSRAFPRHYAAIIQAGEEAGALPQVMARLAHYLERGQILRQKVGMAMIYPLVVMVVASLVVGVLLTYVVPQVVSVFEQSRQTLPWLTRGLIAVSDFARQTWWAALILALGSGFLARHLLTIPGIRLRWHRFLLRLPVLGSLRSGLASARFANTLSVLVGSGVPIVNALSHAGAALDDEIFRAATVQAAARVSEGQSIGRALKQTGVFPGMLLHLVASGEASGELSRVLEQAARQQESSVETRLSALTALLEPLLILVMGGVVLVIVLATLEPIIEMNRLVR